MYDFTGKVALITGAARKKGLGRHTALRLASEGADIAVNDILVDPEELDPWDKEVGWRGLESLVSEIQAMGRRAIAIPGDVSDTTQVAEMVQKAVSEFGKIDILVNNASLLRREIGRMPAVEISTEVWNWTINVNLNGVFYMCREVASQMIKQGHGGKIINLSSRNGKQPVMGQAGYSASKAGVISLTQSFGQELGQYKINVNAICPGPLVTWSSHGKDIYESMQQGLSEAEATAKSYVKDTEAPLGGQVQVEDAVNLIAFLASEQSSYMTGQAINIDGGRLTVR